MECLSLACHGPLRAMCSPRRVALRALSGKARMLRRRKHRTPGHQALPLALSKGRESPRPSVQLPAGIERKPRLIGPFGQKARIAATVSGLLAPPAALDPLQDLGKLDGEVGALADVAIGLRLVAALRAQPVELGQEHVEVL